MGNPKIEGFCSKIHELLLRLWTQKFTGEVTIRFFFANGGIRDHEVETKTRSLNS